MTQYFFPVSRKHHAVSMAIDFGMKFVNRSGFWSPEGLLAITGADDYRIVVAEESLHLLEPQVGDLVSFVDGHAAKVGYLAKRHPDTFHVCGGIISFDTKRDRILDVVHRNGVPFHFPEVEL